MTKLKHQALLFMWVVILAILLVASFIVNFSIQALACLALALFFGGTVTFATCFPAGFWSPASLFYIVLGLFHLGLTPFWIFGLDPMLTLRYDYIWYDGEAGIIALNLVILSIVSYTIGALVVLNFSTPNSKHRDKKSTPSSKIEYPIFQSAGPIFLIMSIGAWATVAVSSGGFGIFFSSYRNFLNATAGAPLGYAYLFIGLALGLTFIYPVKSFIGKTSVAFFVIFAVIAFFMGLRGEVLFPTMVGASVLAMRRKMPNAFITTIFFLLTLTLINLAKEVRNQGINSSDFSWFDASPLSALSELGSSIRVVATVANWHELLNEPFKNGTTYSVSVIRLIESMYLSSERIAASDDYRLMNIEIADRAGNIGGSIIGEAYHNFSFIGVCIVLAIFGAIFAYFSLRIKSAASIAIYIGVAVPLFNHIRNSFVPVVPYIIIGVVIFAGLMFIQRFFTPNSPIKSKEHSN